MPSYLATWIPLFVGLIGAWGGAWWGGRQTLRASDKQAERAALLLDKQLERQAASDAEAREEQRKVLAERARWDGRWHHWSARLEQLDRLLRDIMDWATTVSLAPIVSDEMKKQLAPLASFEVVLPALLEASVAADIGSKLQDHYAYCLRAELHIRQNDTLKAIVTALTDLIRERNSVQQSLLAMIAEPEN
jgi:hypothetical protein